MLRFNGFDHLLHHHAATGDTSGHLPIEPQPEPTRPTTKFAAACRRIESEYRVTRGRRVLGPITDRAGHGTDDTSDTALPRSATTGVSDAIALIIMVANGSSHGT